MSNIYCSVLNMYIAKCLADMYSRPDQPRGRSGYENGRPGHEKIVYIIYLVYCKVSNNMSDNNPVLSPSHMRSATSDRSDVRSDAKKLSRLRVGFSIYCALNNNSNF